MQVQLRYHELVMLLQALNMSMVQQAREQEQRGVPVCEIATPLEAALFDKLHKAHMEEMELIQEAAGDSRLSTQRAARES